MSVPHSARGLPESYFELVRQFPLVSIGNDRQLQQAQERLDAVLRMELDEGRQAYLDALTDLVERYEDEHVCVPDAPSAEVLRFLMDSHGLSQHKLSKAVGIAQSTISAVLTGNRELTVEHVGKLAGYFQVPGAVFLPR